MKRVCLTSSVLGGGGKYSCYIRKVTLTSTRWGQYFPLPGLSTQHHNFFKALASLRWLVYHAHSPAMFSMLYVYYGVPAITVNYFWKYHPKCTYQKRWLLSMVLSYKHWAAITSLILLSRFYYLSQYTGGINGMNTKESPAKFEFDCSNTRVDNWQDIWKDRISPGHQFSHL